MSVPFSEKVGLDRGSDVPLFRQIADDFRGRIQDGGLAAGQRLPAIRSLAESLGVNRSTVQMAYRDLESGGLVETKVGSGTRVRAGLRARHLQAAGWAEREDPAAADGPWQPRFSRSTGEAYALFVATEGKGHEEEARFDFARLMPAERTFPVAAFRASLERVLDREGAALLSYGPTGGYGPLREVLAARLTRSGTPTAPAEILVTSGAQQGIDLCLRAFAEAGDAVVLGAPTYHQMFGLLRSLALEPRTVSEGQDGLDEAELAGALGRGARLVYAMPTFHNPTGRTWSLATRQRFLESVARFAGPIVEDDFEEELRFTGLRLPTLRSLAKDARVISLGTVSKGLFPGARVGWIAAERDVVERLAALKRFSDLSSGLLVQAALADFIERGEFDRHLAGVRADLAEKHAALQSALEAQLGDLARWTRPEGGYAAWVTFPPEVDSRELARLAAERGVAVAPGHLFEPERGQSSSVRLTVARVEQSEIEPGVAELARAARELARKQSLPRSVFV